MLRSLLRLLFVVALAGCARDAAEETAIDRDTFVETYAELRRAALESRGGPDFQARKDEILARRQTTEEELRDFLRAHADDPEFLAGLWKEIAGRTLPETTDAPATP